MEMKILLTSGKEKQTKDDFDLFSGQIAGVCYMQNGIDSLLNEDSKKSLKRAEMTKSNGHHSVFEHEYISLYLENVPKLFAMLLNNEKAYVTSEKSARYTNMECNGITSELYDKWYAIFAKLITEKYGNETYFTKSRIDKLAKENARYFLSVFTPTSLIYTTSYRQLNYLYGWLSNIEKTQNKYLKKLESVAKEFCALLEENNLVGNFDDGKERDFSLFAKKDCKEYFGDVYVTKYKASFALLAQTQRHRTLSYEISPIYPSEFFVPKILQSDEKLKKMWLEDMQKCSDEHPQAELVNIIEKGTPENFVLKTKERLCTSAQQEIMESTKNTLLKYIEKTDDEVLKEYLKKYSAGARCTSGYKCKTPCKFKDGINLEREI